MDLRLSDQQQELVRTVRDFLEREAVPRRRDWDRAEEVDRAFVNRMGEHGLFGLGIPTKYGGTPCDVLTYALALEELGRVDCSLRGLVSVSLGLVGKSILAHGTEEHRQRWLPAIASGRSLGCFALTEPDTGSDAAALTTSARRVGGHYVVNGTKTFITNGDWADVCLLLVRTGAEGARGLSALLVPTDAPGFTARRIGGKLGLRGQPTAELTFTDLRVPVDYLLGKEGEGFKIAMSALDKGRLSVAAGCVGLAQACLEDGVSYATSRHQFGRPIAGFQLVQEMIAEMSIDVDAARLLTWKGCDLADRGEPFAVAASKAKLFASEAAVRCANNAVQIHGGNGYIDEYTVGKFLRDARVITLYEGTSQIQKLLVGRGETGIAAFN